MSKPKNPPQIASFALTKQGENSAALALHLLGDLETKQRHFTIPKGAGELLCWSSDVMKYQSLPYVEKKEQKIYRIPDGSQLQLHIFEGGDWCEQMHLCYEIFCKPKLSNKTWNSQNSHIQKVHIEWQEITTSLSSFLQTQSLLEISLHWCTVPKNHRKIHFSGSHLQKLECFGCDFVELSSSLSDTLIELTLSACYLNDDQILNFPSFTNLAKLSFYENPITDKALSYLSSHPNIEILDLRFTNITGWNFAHISKLDKLKILNVHGSQVQNTIFTFLSYLQHLRRLDVRETKVNGLGIDNFHTQRRALQLPRVEIISDT